MRKVIASLLVLVMVAGLVCDSGHTQNKKLRVLVEVLGDQKEEVKKYVDIALNLLDDVEIVEESPNVYIHMITRKLVTNKGRKLGFVMTSASSEVREMVVGGGTPVIVSDYSGLWLEVGPDIYKLCEQCVKAVNASVFERMRAVEGIQ